MCHSVYAPSVYATVALKIQTGSYGASWFFLPGAVQTIGFFRTRKNYHTPYEPVWIFRATVA